MLFVCAVFIFAIAIPFVFADTIILKSGQSLEGKIIKKTDKYIKIDFQGNTSTYNMDEVAKIEEGKSLTSNDVISGPSTGLSDLEKSADQAFLDGRYEDTLLDMRKIIQLEPKNPELYIGLGMACYYAGRLEESVSAFQKALKLRTSVLPRLYTYLGIVYDSMGDS